MILQEVFAPVNEVKPLSKDQMDAMDKAREQDDFVLPELEKPEPGFFDGMGEASWKGVASGALKSASALDTVLSSTGMVRAALNNAQIETGYTFDDLDKRQSEIENRLNQDSKELRRRAKDDFGIDPTTMGTAAQIVYGVAETIPKAIGYSVLAGPAGGSVLFGADLGISRTQELMDEGVDKKTAINAGLVTFGTAALGMRLPATFGRSRIASATIGAAANAGLTVAELQGVNWVLQNQNYNELAQKYQLNGIDLATSAIFGGVMGVALWRPGMNPSRPQTAKERSVPLQERIKRQLREASPEHLTDEQIDYQARVHATGIQVMADRAQIDADAIAPEIVRGDSAEGLNQIIGQVGVENLRESGSDISYQWVAESMEKQGKSAETIRLATGWERGADGQWRYEIPDIQIKDGAFRVIEEANTARDAEQDALFERSDLSDDELIDQDRAIADKYENQTLTTKLEDVVDAPELFRAYPQLKDLTVEFGRLSSGERGYYAPGSKTIRLPRRADIFQNATRSTLAHEIQHAIQDIEGFARGSNLEENSFANVLRADLQPLYAMMQDSEAWKIYREMEDQASELMDDGLMARAAAYADDPEIQAIFKEQQRLRDKYGINHDILEAIANFHTTSDSIWQKIHENHLDYARQRYYRSAGEVEARNVQDRLDMTNEQRRQSTLESTESYPRNEQIVRYGDNLYRDSNVSIDEQIGNIERIADWLSDDNLNWAKGKSYQEIFAHFGNEPQPVAFIPKEWLTKLFGEEIADNRVYSGKAYFIDHAVNHHPEDIDLEAYVLMQEMISKNTEAIIDDRKGKKGVIFVKQYDKNYLLAVELRQEDDGKIHLYKSLSKTRSKKPYPNLRRAQLPVDALNSLKVEPSQYIRTSEEAHGGRRFSALDNSIDIVGQNANDVNEFVPDSELIQRAKYTFGTTNDVREAFYVLPDGTMLDGSGRHWGGDERDVAGQRQVDHGDIGEIIDDSTNPADAMYKWMARSGAMRFDQIVGIASIARKPTPQQLAVLSRASRGKYLALSLNTPEGRIVDDIEFERANPSKIRHFFEQAQVKAYNGVAGAFAQENRGSFNPSLNRITLTANANISTYSHEMGHWYLENLFQLSRLAKAESTLKEDADILLKEFGLKSIDDWDALGIEGQRKYQEQFASWMEIYLTEGRAPKPVLQRLFERLGQWLVDLYRELGGVKKAVGDTYKAEVGEELPPVSDEVAKVLDRLFAQDRKIRKASQVSKAQVAAARMVQANRTNNNKLEEIIAMPNGKNKTRALRDLEKSTKAQLKAIQAMKRGLPVEVSQDVEQMNVDVDQLVEMKGNFGRAYVMGYTDSVVVLQNRDRSDVGSIAQMNAIAANPQYGLVSVSRSYSGAPVVSYGSVPDSAHLGNNDFIVETNGNRVPFMYAVVEASDVETSNFIDGSTNTGYGNPKRMNAVVGNGRMTALKEAYNRGTANKYRADLEADTAHGIKSEVIQKMKNPVLVRVINPEDVTTGFISRSNGQQVLALDDVELAREDAPKIRARAGQYEFDEAGNPTNDTLALFIQDLHDPNALGRLITSDGRPTPEAVRRIRNAVFFEAYQSPELSALFSQEVDPGIRRILNGMANVAPRIIELREQAQQLDFSNLLVEAANRIRQARLNPDEGVDFASQTSFLDNPASSAFVEFLNDNANSAAAIARTLNPLIDWAENAAKAADGGLFGGDTEVHVDLADVVGQLRNIINDQRADAGLELLPEIDVNALRDQIQTTVDTVTQAVDEVNARIEAETQQAEVDIANEAQALNAQRQQSLAVLDEKSSVDARAQFLMEQNPDQVYRVLDENGIEVQGTLNDLLAQADDEVRQAEIEAAGIGRAVECVLRNGGI